MSNYNLLIRIQKKKNFSFISIKYTQKKKMNFFGEKAEEKTEEEKTEEEKKEETRKIMKKSIKLYYVYRPYVKLEVNNFIQILKSSLFYYYYDFNQKQKYIFNSYEKRQEFYKEIEKTYEKKLDKEIIQKMIKKIESNWPNGELKIVEIITCFFILNVILSQLKITIREKKIEKYNKHFYYIFFIITNHNGSSDFLDWVHTSR